MEGVKEHPPLGERVNPGGNDPALIPKKTFGGDVCVKVSATLYGCPIIPSASGEVFVMLAAPQTGDTASSQQQTAKPCGSVRDAQPGAAERNGVRIISLLKTGALGTSLARIGAAEAGRGRRQNVDGGFLNLKSEIFSLRQASHM